MIFGVPFGEQANGAYYPSIQQWKSAMTIRLPTIKLDTTRSDLYKQLCPSLASKRIGYIFCGTTFSVDLSPDFPKNRKYVYQDRAFNDGSRAQKSDVEVQQSLAPKYLPSCHSVTLLLLVMRPYFSFTVRGRVRRLSTVREKRIGCWKCLPRDSGRRLYSVLVRLMSRESWLSEKSMR